MLNGTLITFDQAEAYMKSHMTAEQYTAWLKDSDRDNYREDEDDYEFAQRWLREHCISDNESEDLAYCMYWCNE